MMTLTLDEAKGMMHTLVGSKIFPNEIETALRVLNAIEEAAGKLASSRVEPSGPVSETPAKLVHPQSTGNTEANGSSGPVCTPAQETSPPKSDRAEKPQESQDEQTEPVRTAARHEQNRELLARLKHAWLNTRGTVETRVAAALDELRVGEIFNLSDVFKTNAAARSIASQIAHQSDCLEYHKGSPGVPTKISRIKAEPEIEKIDGEDSSEVEPDTSSTTAAKPDLDVGSDAWILSKLLEAMPLWRKRANLRDLFPKVEQARRAATIADQDRRFARTGIIVERISE